MSNNSKKEEFKKEMEDIVIANPMFSFEEKEGGERYWTLDEEKVNMIDTHIKTITSFMSENSGIGLTDPEKDALYGQAVEYWTILNAAVVECKYNLYMNRPEYNYLRKTLIEKAEYDIETIFFGIDILPSLEGMKEEGGNFSNDDDILAFKYNSRDITIIYHLISKHKVKGLNKETITFANLVRRLGKVSRVFDFYSGETKTIAEAMNQWIAAFTEDSRSRSKGMRSEGMISEYVDGYESDDYGDEECAAESPF